MNTFASRLILFRETHLSITQTEFCDRCNKIVPGSVSQQNISQWENGEGKASTKKMSVITKAFPELNREWLEQGQGEMINRAMAPIIRTLGDNESYWKDVAKHLEDKIRLQEELIAELKKRK